MIHDLRPGTVLDRYAVERVLASGGYGVVVRARHVHLGSTHAIKLLALNGDLARQRFIREGQIQAKLRHPGLVPVTDILMLGEAVALVMECIDGPNLLTWTHLHRPSFEEVDRVAEQLFETMGYAHEAGFIHRDLKPENVLVERRGDELHTRVTDFGLAVLQGPEGLAPRLTRSGQGLGTPCYMAPEQYRDARHADVRCDIYALGALLYELLARRPVNDAPTLVDAYEVARNAAYAPLVTLAPDAPLRMIHTVEAALRPNPDDRPATVEALRQRWRDGQTPLRVAWSAAALDAVVRPPELPVMQTIALEDPLPEPAPDRVTLPPQPSPPNPRSADGPDPLKALGLLVGMVLVGIITWVTLDFIASKQGSVEGSAPVVATIGAPAQVPAETATKAASPGEPAATATPMEPAPTPEPERSAEPVRTSLKVTGVQRAQLRSATGEVMPGWSLRSSRVAPGRYTLDVWFDTATPTPVLDVELREGERRTVRCTPELRVCR